METRLQYGRRMRGLLLECTDDIWDKIIDYLDVREGSPILLVNKQLSKLYYKKNRDKILMRLMQNVWWGDYKHILWMERFLLDVHIPSNYQWIFCKMITEDPSVIDQFARMVHESLIREMDGCSLSETFELRHIFSIEYSINWNIDGAIENSKEFVKLFAECKAYFKKIGEMLFLKAQQYFNERNLNVRKFEITDIVHSERKYLELRWCFKRCRNGFKFKEYKENDNVNEDADDDEEEDDDEYSDSDDDEDDDEDDDNDDDDDDDEDAEYDG